MSMSADLSAYVVKTRFQDLPGAATIAAKHSLLDAIGVTLAASGLSPECRPFIELAIASGGTPEATIIGFGNKISAPLAALANGAMAHALDFEDAYDPAPCHPNAQMIPAALAIAEATGASGREVVAALAVGCDLVCRLGLSLTVSFDTFGWYPPPILGAYGAAAAAGKLLKLTPEQMLDAFSLVLCQATCSAELKYSPHSTIRAVRDAFAAQAGVLSALLAQRGVKGFDLPFEGKAGFFALYARGQYEPARITENLGSVFEGVNISYKAWPACRGTHSYIEAALALSKQHKLNPADIKHIALRGSAFNSMLFEPVAQKQKPQTAIDAKFSLPYTVGTALVHGDVGLDRFLPAAMADAAVLALAARTSFAVDPSFEKTFRDATRGVLQIETMDGRRLEKSIDHPLGHPNNPMDEARLIAKFKDCGHYAATPLPDHALSALADDVLALERLDTIAPVMARLTADAPRRLAGSF
jgi:2-methylcitrate dehydratase PrpD